MIDKPLFREPCNRCGICCSLELCRIAEVALGVGLGHEPPCHFLAEDGGCKLVAIEAESLAEPFFARALGIGCGCSMPDENTTEAEILAFEQESKLKVYGRCQGPIVKEGGK